MPTTVRTPSGTSRAAKARAARSSSSSCAPTRLRSNRMALRPLRSLRMLAALLGLAALGAAQAQHDLTGHWSQRFHEDLPERGAGPEIGDYTGLPINDAARLRAD